MGTREGMFGPMAGFRRRLGAFVPPSSKRDRADRRTVALTWTRKRTAVGLALLVGLATLVPAPAMARWWTPDGIWNFDIVGVSMSPPTVVQGDSVTLTVDIKNVGNERSEERRVGKEWRSQWTPDH